MVALQNIENNEVPCKIFLAKELRYVSVSTGRFRLTGGAKRTCRTMFEGKLLRIIVQRSGEIICKDWPSRQLPAVGQPLTIRSQRVRGIPGPQTRGTSTPRTKTCPFTPDLGHPA